MLRSGLRRVAAVSLLVLAVVVAAAGWAGASRSQAGAGKASAVPKLARIVVIVFENREYDQVIGDSHAPTFNRLARRYALLTDYYGVAHPSLPNYLALVSGSTQGITSNCTTCTVDAPNLVDSLEQARKTWKSYAEGLP